MNGLALCAGIGGLELGLKLALGDAYRTVCHVEWDAFAAATLVARMEDAALGPAPVWDDLLTFDGRPWRGLVDVVTAGFPCQPWSVAGKRRKTADARWIWPDIARCIREVEPGWVFLENVPGLVRGGLEHVLRDLAALGFAAEWDLFSAESLGLPHKRERLFILAHARRGRDDPGEPFALAGGVHPAGAGEARPAVADGDRGGWREREQDLRARQPVAPRRGAQLADAARQRSAHADGERIGAGHELAGSVGVALADADGGSVADAFWGTRERARLGQAGEGALANAARRGVRRGIAPGSDRFAAQPDESLSDAGGVRLQARGLSGRTQPDGRSDVVGDGLPLVPPGPDDRDAWEHVESIDPDALPALRRVAHGLPYGMERPELRHRADRLRCLGNGVVPVVAGYAFVALADRLRGE